MEKTKHTPGPWLIQWNNSTNVEVICNEPKHKSIAQINPYHNGARLEDYPFEEYNANAKLIAAAPELLEALRFCQSVIKSQGMFDTSERMAFDKAEIAIKKATE